MTIPWNFTGCYSVEEWKVIIEDRERSGLSKRAYCRMRTIPYDNFYRWQNKIYPSNSLTLKEVRERWKQLIRNWEKSGLSKNAYCMDKGLNPSMFYLREKEFNSHVSRKTSHMEAIEKWTPIVKDWKKSGLNKWKYCLKHELTYTTLCKWIKNLDSSESLQLPTGLIKAPHLEMPLQDQVDPTPLNSIILADSASASQKIEITLSQGQSFCLEGPFDWPKLTAWLTPLLTR